MRFSGTVRSAAHELLEKEELHAKAEEGGLVAVPTSTKTRTDVLVVAEVGPQPSKSHQRLASLRHLDFQLQPREKSIPPRKT